jgi:hypothetical protein
MLRPDVLRVKGRRNPQKCPQGSAAPIPSLCSGISAMELIMRSRVQKPWLITQSSWAASIQSTSCARTKIGIDGVRSGGIAYIYALLETSLVNARICFNDLVKLGKMKDYTEPMSLIDFKRSVTIGHLTLGLNYPFRESKVARFRSTIPLDGRRSNKPRNRD